MDPTNIHWLKEYLEFRNDDLKNKRFKSERDLYYHIQNMGINYGHFLNIPEDVELEISDWPIRERNKVLYAEVFLAAVNYAFENEKENLITEFKNFSVVFYKNSFEKPLAKVNPFIKRSKYYKSENYFNKKVVTNGQWNKSFYKAFLNNLLIYSDVLILIKLKYDIKNKEKFESEISKLHLNFSKVIFAILKDKKELSNSIFEFLNHENKQFKAKKISIENSSVENLELDSNDGFLIRKFLLDTAIITSIAFEEKIDDEFMRKLTIVLNFDEDELKSSILGADLFIVGNWEKLNYLKSKFKYIYLSNRINSSIRDLTKKYESEIIKIISKDEALQKSILEIANKYLHIDKKEKLRYELIGVLKKIKPLKSINLPSKYFTFSLLLKILPKSIFPTEFSSEKTNNSKKNRFIDS